MNSNECWKFYSFKFGVTLRELQWILILSLSENCEINEHCISTFFWRLRTTWKIHQEKNVKLLCLAVTHHLKSQNNRGNLLDCSGCFHYLYGKLLPTFLLTFSCRLQGVGSSPKKNCLLPNCVLVRTIFWIPLKDTWYYQKNKGFNTRTTTIIK